MSYSPGVFVLEEMCERGWTRAVMIEKSGLSRRRLNALIFGEAKVTADDAVAIGKAFGTSEVLWSNLQKSFEAGR